MQNAQPSHSTWEGDLAPSERSTEPSASDSAEAVPPRLNCMLASSLLLYLAVAQRSHNAETRSDALTEGNCRF